MVRGEPRALARQGRLAPRDAADRADALRAAFVYANPRRALAAEIAAGRAPDTGLLGQNHLAPLGIDAFVHDARLAARGRLLWNLRELTVPWEVRAADVVCTPLAQLLPLAARLRRRPRTLVFNMGLCTRFDRSGPAARRVLSGAVRAADAVVCFAEAQRERLLAQTGADPERVHAVLLGVDERYLRPAAPAPPDGHVLAVGRDLARDYATLAAAVDGLDARVVVVASARNLERVAFPANVEVRLDASPAELRDLYERARCVAIPTRHESFPYGADCSGQTVLLDAYAMARPVVVSDRSTLRDYVVAGAATVVPPEDAAALRQALEAPPGDGAAGRERVERELSTAALAGRLAPLIRRAARLS